jgi:hypothetical protein
MEWSDNFVYYLNALHLRNLIHHTGGVNKSNKIRIKQKTQAHAYKYYFMKLGSEQLSQHGTSAQAPLIKLGVAASNSGPAAFGREISIPPIKPQTRTTIHTQAGHHLAIDGLGVRDTVRALEDTCLINIVTTLRTKIEII